MNSPHPGQPIHRANLDSLDKQHRKLLEITARIGDFVEDQNRSDPNGKLDARTYDHLINDLFEFSTDHFRWEEELLASIRYPDLEKHRVEHDEFIYRLSEFLFAAATGVPDISGSYRFLTAWIDKHEFESDMDYRKHLAKN